MPDSFIDTSALAKHYHTELGTDKVDQLLADLTSRRVISRLSVVEIHSVFAKKVRTGALSSGDFQLLCRQFRGDVQQRKFQVARVTSPHFQSAEKLLRRLGPSHNLRTLDALQLATALDLKARGAVHQLVTADQGLFALAAAEGLTVVNAEAP